MREVLDTAIEKKDRALTALYALAFASMVGSVGAVTLLPDHGGGYGLDSVLYSVAGYDITVAAVLAVGSAVAVFGSNRVQSFLTGKFGEHDDDITIEEAGTFALAAGLPSAYVLFDSVASATAGAPAMQGIVTVLGLVGFTFFARAPTDES